jgi:hypothetical protein
VAGTQDPSDRRDGSTNGERSTGGRQPTSEPTGTSPQADAADQGRHVCDVAFCPIGLALSAVQPLKPDVVEHLLVAGRELLLAAKAVIDARVAEDPDGGPAPTLERIDIG